MRTRTRTRPGALLTTLVLAATMIVSGAPAALAAPALVVTGPAGGTTEAGGTTTFDVRLGEAPTDTVTVTVTSLDLDEGTVSPASLTFTTGDWSVDQVVTVTGVDDAVDDGDQAIAIRLDTATSADAGYAALPPTDVTVTNLDDDTRGVTVTGGGGNTTEAGGTHVFTVELDSEPTGDVSIALSSTDPGEGAVDPASLTFTAANWSTPRTVTVTGVDDFVDDGDQAYTVILAAPTGGGYDGLGQIAVIVINLDDDTDGMTVSAVSGPTTEAGGTATFTVVLDAQPTVDVNVAVTSSDLSEGTVSPAAWTFTSANWDEPQTVTVTGVDDAVDDGDRMLEVTITTDGPYDPVVRSVTNVDDDDPVLPPFTSCPETIPSAAFEDLGGLSAEIVHAIDCLAAYGISEGTGPGTFSPTVTVPRWQMALFLTRTLTVLGTELPVPFDHGFADLDGLTVEARDAIARLVSLGVATGTSETTFEPHADVERWHMALFLARLADAAGIGLPAPTGASPFVDLAGYSAEVSDAVGRLAAAGITTGTSDTTFSPSLGVARWQMALFLTRMLTEGRVTIE